MSGSALNILFASRAYESAHIEGGFLLLRDLAIRGVEDAGIAPAFLSSESDSGIAGLELVPAYSRSGWGRGNALRFAAALARHARHHDVVHTAHVPTPTNARILRRISKSARKHGARFVQTVTALPSAEYVRPQLLWGDVVVCLNEATAAAARRIHDEVHVIVPVPGPHRLATRKALPDKLTDQLQDRKLVCMAAELARMTGTVDIVAVCSELLQRREDAVIVVACRFGEEAEARRLFAGLLEAESERFVVMGEIDFLPELLARSSAFLYPVGDITKKFNPPLVTLEAAALGAPVVAHSLLALSGVLPAAHLCQLDTDEADAWASAVVNCIEAGRNETGLLAKFDDTYLQYRSIYERLRAKTIA